MIYITHLHIENYRCFRLFDMDFEKESNIIVGDNEAGKSTILEAINLCLSGLIHGRYLKNELTEYLFNYSCVQEYLESVKNNHSQIPPYILIELYIDSDEENPDLEVLRGTGNSLGVAKTGVSLKIEFDDKYQTHSEYEALVKNGITNIPIEYYKIDWRGFNRDVITSRSIPLKPSVIDSSSTRFKNGSDYYISKIIDDKLSDDEKISLIQAYRNLKNDFKQSEELKIINTKINEMAKISKKNISISVNTSDVNAWENILMTYFDEIPFHQIGQGEQSIIKTNLALNNIRNDIFNVLLLEEPENHLSHSNLNYLLNSIETNNKDKQIIVTTHSSFVANKLGLQKILFINEKKVLPFNNLSGDTQNYFKRLPGYNTLRLVLAQKVILVEGPSDELIIQKAYFEKFKCLPIENSIDVISVGLSAPRFLEIAKELNIKVAVVTDNDGDKEKKIIRRYNDFLSYNNIKVFTNSDNNQNTLEPSFVKCDAENEKKLKALIGYTGTRDLSDYLQKCKTEWALAVFESEIQFSYPDYINECIDWISHE